MIGYCKDCGIPLYAEEAEHSMYCPMCKARRHRDPVEIDPETGEWEGVTHGEPRKTV